MILVELTGGLGNQLFQYAAAKSLSLHHQAELKLDTQFFTQRGQAPALEQFHVTDKAATPQEIRSFHRTPWQRMTDRLKPAFKRLVYREPFFHFDPDFFRAGNPVYLKGLRQSEKYFLPYEQAIRQTLTVKKDLVAHLSDQAERLQNENSVSVHIRRGDYLTKVALEVLGLTPVEYYQKAITRLGSELQNPVFYFFSDDIEWVKANLKLHPSSVFLSGNITKTAIEDLYLMSRCRHNIIANSSFSWWGAWLNNNPQKTVMAPGQWFNKGPKDTQDLIPAGWQIVSS
jgi:hypothetical protein